jgi:hypothetical protein
MTRHPDFCDAVSDIRALLGEDGTAAELGPSAAARLAQIRRDITAASPAASGRRAWWPHRHPRQARKVVITCVAVPAVLAAAAAGWAVATAPPASRVTLTVVCYSLPHPPERGVSESAAGGTDSGLSPVALCARQWRAGMVVPGVHRVPAGLVACANPGLGEVAVFPGTTCAAVHLPPLPAGYQRAARRFDSLTAALTAGLTGSRRIARCPSAAQALSFTRQTARAHGFSRWRIIVGQSATGQACWQAQADPAVHAIQIVPQPGGYPPAVARAERIIRTTLSVPAHACQSGSPPQDATAVTHRLRAALRRAGLGAWTITLTRRATRQQPCYEQARYPATGHAVSLTPAAFPGTTY